MNTKLNNIVKPLLAVLIVLLSFTYFFTVTFIGTENPQILIAVVAMDSAIIGYYYGSSSGTAKKDETIQTMIDKKE